MVGISGVVESSGGLTIGSTRTFPGGLAAELARSAIADGRWGLFSGLDGWANRV